MYCRLGRSPRCRSRPRRSPTSRSNPTSYCGIRSRRLGRGSTPSRGSGGNSFPANSRRRRCANSRASSLLHNKGGSPSRRSRPWRPRRRFDPRSRVRPGPGRGSRHPWSSSTHRPRSRARPAVRCIHRCSTSRTQNRPRRPTSDGCGSPPILPGRTSRDSPDPPSRSRRPKTSRGRWSMRSFPGGRRSRGRTSSRPSGRKACSSPRCPNSGGP